MYPLSSLLYLIKDTSIKAKILYYEIKRGNLSIMFKNVSENRYFPERFY